MVPTKSIRVPPLRGGANYNKNSLSLLPDQAGVLRNCHLDSDGFASTRRGLRKLNATSLGGPIESIYQFVRPNGSGVTRTVLVSTDEKWFYWDESSDTFIEFADINSKDRPSLATFQDGTGKTFCFLANGTDFIKYDGTTVDRATSVFRSNSNPRYLMVYDNRLMATGCDLDPFIVFASDLLDGTTWGASSYFSFSNDNDRERIMGLGKFNDFLTVVKTTSVHILTEGDPASDTVEQIMVHDKNGTTSHWSIVTAGNNIFFSDASGVYRGQLRAAVENGMVVKKISDNIEAKYLNGFEYNRLSGIYLVEKDEIFWGFRDNLSDRYDKGLVFNKGLSIFDTGLESNDRPIWSGVWDGNGFRSYTVGSVLDSNNKQQIWFGDEDGYVYVMEDTQFNDDSNYIVTEIGLAPFYPAGLANRKRFNSFYPLVFMNHNESVKIDWVIDSSYRSPSVSVTMELEGNIPYWNDALSIDRTQKWGNTIFKDQPMIPVAIDVNDTGSFIQFFIKCAGTNSKDDIVYGGAELYYQVLNRRR
jgi:hypothetical protein